MRPGHLQDVIGRPMCLHPARVSLMTGNVAQVFLTGEDWAQALRAIGAVLRPPAGTWCSRPGVPGRRAWEEWAADPGPVTLDIPGSGLESSLAAEGYRVLDVRDAPDRPGREFVFITQHAT
jgi:hypothetical protein